MLMYCYLYGESDRKIFQKLKFEINKLITPPLLLVDIFNKLFKKYVYNKKTYRIGNTLYIVIYMYSGSLKPAKLLKVLHLIFN